MSTTDVTEARQQFSLAPQNVKEALEFAEMMSKSNLVPKEFSGNPGNILVAIQWGMELGLQPMQAMQNIAVINGRPSLWGDSVIALVKASPTCEYVVEEVTDDKAVCKVKRRGEPEQSRVFSKADAQAAGLLNKQGPWTQYPKRMLQMRARSWALRDVFPDVLRGMPVAEELMDMPKEQDVTSAGSHEIKKEYYTNAEFGEKKDGWKAIVADGKKTGADLIAFVESKGKLFTEAQRTEILAWKGPAKPVEPAASQTPTTIEGEAQKVDDPFIADLENAESTTASQNKE
jgi:hypothetical protein